MAAIKHMKYPVFTTKETRRQKRGEEKVYEHQPFRRKADINHHNEKERD